MRIGFAFLACTLACGCSGGLGPSYPVNPIGDSSLIQANAAVRVSPDETHVWIPHGGNLLAVDTSSGVISTVYPITGLSDLRMAFLESNLAILLATDPSGCPFSTTACSRFVRIHTDSLAADAVAWEGSTFQLGELSPSGNLLALTGGFWDEGTYLVGADGAPELLHWSAGPSAMGWSRCLSGCDERLWIVGGATAQSWRATGGQLEAAPDLSFDLDCGPLFYGLRPQVAASPNGRFVALSCANGNFSLFDSLTGSLRSTVHQGQVAFADGDKKIVGHDVGDLDEAVGSPDESDDKHIESCLELIDTTTLDASFLNCDLGVYRYYVTRDGRFVFIDGSYALDVSGAAIRNGAVSSLSDGEFVERPGHGQLWEAKGGALVRLDVLDGETAFTSTRVDHLNVLPMQDRLALLASDSSLTLTFFSMVTDSAQQVVTIP